jgi:hypothetical protein
MQSIDLKPIVQNGNGFFIEKRPPSVFKHFFDPFSIKSPERAEAIRIGQRPIKFGNALLNLATPY